MSEPRLLDKLPMAHLPTPLWRHPALDALVGCELWVKRDDMSAGAMSGNKIRKLEYLLAQAKRDEATWIVTCGGEQSNHARTTALAAASLGMGCTLVLRTAEPTRPPALTNNLMLAKIAGAHLEFVSPEQYENWEELLEQTSERLRARGERPYVIGEGGSEPLGVLGYVNAMAEIRGQLDVGLAGSVRNFDEVCVPYGSGGTAAGVLLGSALYRIAPRVTAICVCSRVPIAEGVIARLVEETRSLDTSMDQVAELDVTDDFVGPGYGVATSAQWDFMREVASHTGMVLDPVYSGKALYGLAQRLTKEKPQPSEGAEPPAARRVLFIHTGGLPGLLAQATQFESQSTPQSS